MINYIKAKCVYSLVFALLFCANGPVIADGKLASKKASSSSIKEMDIVDLIPDICEAVVNIVDLSAGELVANDNERRSSSSIGSGFFISDDGFFITNQHVYATFKDNIQSIRIVLHDGSEFIPKSVGSDARADIALLKIEPGKKVKFLQLADSDKVKVGVRVIAVGNPFGFGHTVTSGIISCKSRNISDSLSPIGGGDLVDYIQTDTSINNGSSGGPLLLSETEDVGKVIGMNTSMFSNSEYNSGINFAIPSNTISSVVQQLKKFGKMRRAWLGIIFEKEPISSEVLTALGVGSYHNAVLVTKVERNSPASKVGIQANDIILSIGKQVLSNKNRANMLVSLLEVGKPVKISLLRDEKIKNIELIVGYKENEEQPEHDSINELSNIPGTYITELDMTVTDITQEVVGLVNISPDQKGVVISDVNNVLRNQYDILKGDIILYINQKPVYSVKDITSYLENMKNLISIRGRVALFIKRDRSTLYKVAPLKKVKK